MSEEEAFGIIDAHAHIFPEKIAQKATAAIGAFYDLSMDHEAGLAQTLLDRGRLAGIRLHLVCSTATVPAQVTSINDFIASECAAHPEFFGLATMHPEFEWIADELERVKALGLHGVKLHPDFQKFNIDSPAAFPIYEAAEALGLPILFHTGDNRYEFSSPDRLARVAERYPGLKCIAAHFGGYRQWDLAAGTLAGLPNVWFDTSSSLFAFTPEEAARRLRHFGTDRMMFGTDFPMWDPKEELARFFALPLTREEREQVLRKTFLSLFQRS